MPATFEADPAPRGGHSRAVSPPNDSLCPSKRKLCPPKRGLCPEEIKRLGATGVQMEAKNSQISVYRRNFCALTPGFLLRLGRRPFFFVLHLRIRGKSQKFRDDNKNLWKFLFSRPFFVGLLLFRLIHTRIDFSCPV